MRGAVYHILMSWRLPVAIATTVLQMTILQGPALAAIDFAQAETSSELRLRALDLAYNLDHDQAVDLLRRAVALAPDDPAAHRSLASVLWLNILFRRGAVTVDHYLGSFTGSSVDLPKPPPELDREFKLHVTKAIELAEKRVAANPKDPQAHYDLGAAVGLQASYTATVEGSLLAGFRAAKRCYDEHEKVLALDPSRKDAGLVVGTYRYVVSTQSLPMRMLAYVAGFGGGRERGIQMLQETAEFNLDTSARTASQGGGRAESGNDVRADAMFALILVYNREHRYDDALKVLERLQRIYPRNRLLWLEAGSTALRAKRGQQADDLLTQGLAMFAKDARPKMPGEEALWRYKRGAARALLGRTTEAMADLSAATGADSQAWVSGRARVELGRLALKRGDRGTATNEAKQAEMLCERGNDPTCVEDARTLLRNSNAR
jgi:tetratricopeptide (TPR) repeat protein